MNVLSILAAPAVAAAGLFATPQAMTAPAGPVRLSGSLHVTYITAKSNPDAGPSYRFTGKGKIRPIGKVQMRGTAQAPGFIREATPIGQFTLMNEQGSSITLRLVYPKTPGFSPLPNAGTFRIVDANGIYAGDSGVGKFTSQLTRAICNSASVITHSRCRGTGTFHFTGQKGSG